MKLVENWRKGWRMLSVQFMTIATALQGAWLALPSSLVENVPPWVMHAITMGLLFAGIAGRLVYQPKINDEPDQGN